jgi:hypothetical protein
MNRADRQSSRWANLVAIAAVTCALGVLYLPLFLG